VSPIGDWSLDRQGRWVYDANAPSASPEPTSMLPAVPAADPAFAEIYEREDGAIYARVLPGVFASFDEVDSRTIVDKGAPS
jgi:hypothetical protein